MSPDKDAPARLVGEFIRQQRELAAIPLRQLATLAGISNPYLSQIERGLRMPSADVLENIEATLGLVTDPWRETAGHDEDPDDAEPAETPSLPAMIKTDPQLSPAQRRALTEIYVAMVEVTRSRRSE